MYCKRLFDIMYTPLRQSDRQDVGEDLCLIPQNKTYDLVVFRLNWYMHIYAHFFFMFALSLILSLEEPATVRLE